MSASLSGLVTFARLQLNGGAVGTFTTTYKFEAKLDATGALLAAGADGYLTKPFDLGELVARLHALAAKGQAADDEVARRLWDVSEQMVGMKA